jgi:PadR family transcriptional regulator, regulatory protein PadR
MGSSSGRPRMTLPTQLTLWALMADADKPMYGMEICAAAGLPSGTIHPILARLERIGWVTSSWEEIDPSAEGRPRRRYYRIDPNSISAIRAALARSSPPSSLMRGARPRLAEGTP